MLLLSTYLLVLQFQVPSLDNKSLEGGVILGLELELQQLAGHHPVLADDQVRRGLSGLGAVGVAGCDGCNTPI